MSYIFVCFNIMLQSDRASVTSLGQTDILMQLTVKQFFLTMCLIFPFLIFILLLLIASPHHMQHVPFYLWLLASLCQQLIIA